MDKLQVIHYALLSAGTILVGIGLSFLSPPWACIVVGGLLISYVIWPGGGKE